MPIYGLDVGKNLQQVYTTTEVLTILQEAIDNQSLAGLDPSIAPVITAVKESNGNNNITFWVGTEAEFNALGVTAKQIFARVDATGKLYLCTDDSTLDDWLAAAKAEITGDVAADITAAQTTADAAVRAAGDAQDDADAAQRTADGAQNAADAAQGTADTALAATVDLADYFSDRDFITAVALNGTPQAAIDYSISAGASFPKVTAKIPKAHASYLGLDFFFNDERDITAGSVITFTPSHTVGNATEFLGGGVVLGSTDGSSYFVAGCYFASIGGDITVYVEKTTKMIQIQTIIYAAYDHE